MAWILRRPFRGGRAARRISAMMCKGWPGRARRVGKGAGDVRGEGVWYRVEAEVMERGRVFVVAAFSGMVAGHGSEWCGVEWVFVMQSDEASLLSKDRLSSNFEAFESVFCA